MSGNKNPNPINLVSVVMILCRYFFKVYSGQKRKKSITSASQLFSLSTVAILYVPKVLDEYWLVEQLINILFIFLVIGADRGNRIPLCTAWKAGDSP